MDFRKAFVYLLSNNPFCGIWGVMSSRIKRECKKKLECAVVDSQS